ncbi:MAG: GPR endopeptidase, partial [Erysipelotrichaceae bacterium]
MSHNYTTRSDFADEVVKNTNDFKQTIEDNLGIITNYIRITNPDNNLNKDCGDYISIEFKTLNDENYRELISNKISTSLHKIIIDRKLNINKILVVGLGNRYIIADALGPKVMNNILVTAHLYELNKTELLAGTRNVAVLTPGVMGQTGLESYQIVASVAKDYEPDLILVVDALATASYKRINRVIQITDTGIKPGSGVGNQRLAFQESNFNVPVIALGVATVTSLNSIIAETIENTNVEIEQLNLDELNLVVTPKSMDDDLRHLSEVISKGINMFIHPKSQ